MRKNLMLFSMFFLFMGSTKASEINTSSKYFKTMEYANKIVTEEISKEEYYQNDIVCYSNIENTEYKHLEIYKKDNYVIFDVDWKKTPKIKSYDVIALRFENANFNVGLMLGNQLYDNISSINYSYNSNNTQVFDNGVGVSMNLVDSASSYSMTLKLPYTKLSTNAVVYGSYQHAIKDVSLATSQQYYLDSKGMGQVIYFYNNVGSFYDNTPSVSINL